MEPSRFLAGRLLLAPEATYLHHLNGRRKAVPKSPSDAVILSEAKNPACDGEILRSAQGYMEEALHRASAS